MSPYQSSVVHRASEGRVFVIDQYDDGDRFVYCYTIDGVAIDVGLFYDALKEAKEAAQ